eukprot:91792-Prymnesium_polylepis.1
MHVHSVAHTASPEWRRQHAALSLSVWLAHTPVSFSEPCDGYTWPKHGTHTKRLHYRKHAGCGARSARHRLTRGAAWRRGWPISHPWLALTPAQQLSPPSGSAHRCRAAKLRATRRTAAPMVAATRPPRCWRQRALSDVGGDEGGQIRLPDEGGQIRSR